MLRAICCRTVQQLSQLSRSHPCLAITGIGSKDESSFVGHRLLATNASVSPTVNQAGHEDLKLSDSCVKRLQEIGSNGDSPLRVFVEGGGCSGFQYKFELDSKIEENDRIFERDGVKVVIDKDSLELVKGSTIDYYQEMIRSSFRIIDNPQAEQALNMQQLPDFPPLPQCFSHLLVTSDGDPSSSLRSHISASLSKISSRTEGFSNTGSLDDFDHYIMNGTRSSLSCMNHTSSDSEGLINPGSLSSVKNQIAHHNQRNMSPHQSVAVVENGDDVSTDHKNPFLKLQTSLQKLQREMKDLRYLDISLFCQLLSLHDAVQDFKNTVADRYSETGSEYSLGTASYMGSMSSLNDESEWGDDGTTFTFSQEHPENSELVEESENIPSASSLLKQITELVLKADHDF